MLLSSLIYLKNLNYFYDEINQIKSKSNGPFDDRTGLDHLNTKLVHYSDPHCIQIVLIKLFYFQSTLHRARDSQPSKSSARTSHHVNTTSPFRPFKVSDMFTLVYS